ncbi:hypothetical protein Tco_0729382 [Tanacetum coccineum]|uniref:Uncharacterized protein n=1 Tax=Tanacetum coccineum TaxID=301880 RepID=A0ABQ4YR38_9ASTR
MATESIVPQLVDKKGGSYAAIAPKLEPGKFNKWKKCAIKLESQWTQDERTVVIQDQRLKSIIVSCLLDDIMDSVIRCETAKDTWNDLVHSFKGPSDTKEKRIIDLKVEYQTFRAKLFECLSQTYTRYKTLLNELASDGVNLSKHEINVRFMNSLPKKWLTFSQGLRNANHTQTLDLADIYGRFVYEDNLIKRRYSDSKKALVTTPSTPISTDFFSNNVVQDFQEHSDDEIDERTSQEYLRDLDIETKYKKLKAKLALLEPTKFTSQNPKTSQSKNKGLVVEIFDWDEEEVSDDEEMTQVKVLMALADVDLIVGKNHAQNSEWIDITIIKVNILLSMDEDADWQNYLKYINVDLKGELLTESSSKKDVNENLFIPASMGYDQEMVPKSKEWFERHNLYSKLPNFNTERILVPKNQAVNECLKPTKASNDTESSKDSESKSLTPLPPLKSLQGASLMLDPKFHTNMN